MRKILSVFFCTSIVAYLVNCEILSVQKFGKGYPDFHEISYEKGEKTERYKWNKYSIISETLKVS